LFHPNPNPVRVRVSVRYRLAGVPYETKRVKKRRDETRQGETRQNKTRAVQTRHDQAYIYNGIMFYKIYLIPMTHICIGEEKLRKGS
jgi:hypothetical protein